MLTPERLRQIREMHKLCQAAAETFTAYGMVAYATTSGLAAEAIEELLAGVERQAANVAESVKHDHR